MSKENQNPNQNPETASAPKPVKKEAGTAKKSGAKQNTSPEAKSGKPQSGSGDKPRKKKKPQPAEPASEKKQKPAEPAPEKKQKPAEPAPETNETPADPEKKEPAEDAKPEKNEKPAKPAVPARKEPGAGGKRAMDVLLSVLLVGAIGAGGCYVAMQTSPIDHTTTYVTEATEPQETTSPTEEGKTIYHTEMHANTDVHMGDLILVNSKCEYMGTEEGLVSLYELKQEADSHSFSVRDGDLLVRETVAKQLIAMFDGFYNETYDDNIIVQTGYRSRERQQELYDEDLELTGESFSERVSKPGCSEHQSGFCVDLSLVGGEDYDGTGDYAWINEHCYEYGFVLRYESGKTPLTEVKAEPWHYRYVGAPHAYYMTANGLCLEEYMMELKKYPYEGEHLSVTNFDGTVYEIYYVPADTDYDSTMVPVPGKLQYTVSGNNEDGFIVTVNTGETADKPAAPTEAPTEATEADTTVSADESEPEEEDDTTASSEDDSEDDDNADSESDSEAE
ncbi:MAG: D-alanyl-D-alanine carboxypeptidase family protein [Oscillospiraceae bacterium]|nr:D-alanyl-D-alanine carboxypeptidase family protein [Oscillospiraceae bacterium]